MATKRPALTPQVHPSRQPQVPSELRPSKRRKLNHSSQSFKKAHPVNELKSQIRSLTRLLEHEHENDRLPATVRVDKERALQSAKYELGVAERAKRRSEVIGRWHKVRFFDRRTAEKRVRRLRRELERHGSGDGGGEDEGEREVPEEMMRDAEVDVMYAQYYPLEVPYVPLFPRKKAEEGKGNGESGEDEEDGVRGKDDVTERKGDPEMWLRVKQCMADGTLDDLRNGKLTPEEVVEGPTSVTSTARKKRKESYGNGAAKQATKSRSSKSGDADLAGEDAVSDDETGGAYFE